jgi:hypothetical protein
LTAATAARILSEVALTRHEIQAHRPFPSQQADRDHMSAEIISNTGGILTARISGKLTRPELAALQASAVDSIRQQGHIRMLIIAKDFQGWRDGDDWGDVSFMENDPYIKKMAIVGEKKWADLALIFSASPIRKFPIEYFLPADLEQAQAWLTAD